MKWLRRFWDWLNSYNMKPRTWEQVIAQAVSLLP
jgi:hypothetical protein